MAETTSVALFSEKIFPRLAKVKATLLSIKLTSLEHFNRVAVQKIGKISSTRGNVEDAAKPKEAVSQTTRTVVRGPIIIDARTLNAHPSVLSSSHHQNPTTPSVADHLVHQQHHHHHHLHQTAIVSATAAAPPLPSQSQWCSGCKSTVSEVVQSASGTGGGLSSGSNSGPGAPLVGCLLGVYPGASQGCVGQAPSRSVSSVQASVLSQGIASVHHHHHPQTPQVIGGGVVQSTNANCRTCCCHHHQQPATALQLTSQRGGISLRVARVASTTSVRAAPYAHSQHQGLGQECR